MTFLTFFTQRELFLKLISIEFLFEICVWLESTYRHTKYFTISVAVDTTLFLTYVLNYKLLEDAKKSIHNQYRYYCYYLYNDYHYYYYCCCYCYHNHYIIIVIIIIINFVITFVIIVSTAVHESLLVEILVHVFILYGVHLWCYCRSNLFD